MVNPDGKSPTWKPRLVKMPIPTMLATTMHVAVSSETERIALRLSGNIAAAHSSGHLSGRLERCGSKSCPYLSL